jgi:hypothetical protein
MPTDAAERDLSTSPLAMGAAARVAIAAAGMAALWLAVGWAAGLVG